MSLARRRCGTRAAVAAAVGVAVGLVAALALALRATPLPAWWRAPTDTLDGASLVRILDRDGNPLARVRTGDQARVPIRLSGVDPLLVRATLAAEDRRFFLHPGIDPLSVARACGQNLRLGRRVSGGSTLTQQVVKLRRREAGRESGPRSLWTKAREAWWALVLETHVSKREILEGYCNLADYGSDVRGVGAAAQVYFGHGPQTLALEEAALLAALPRSPVGCDPRRDPEAARRARDRVLARMKLPPEIERAARERPVRVCASVGSAQGAGAPHWVERVTQRFPGAAEIRLPIDARLQAAAVAGLRSALRELSERGADAGAVVALHNPTGEVRAWVGSADWTDPDHGQFDAACARRQPGSALKPFTYALAFEVGLRPAHVLPDLPLEYAGADGSFRPRNYSGTYHGPVRARLALANSWNAPAVAVLSRVGPARLLERLRAAGLGALDRPAEEYGLGLTLGDGEVSLMELTTAYACLARGGLARPRLEVLEARDASGRRLPVAEEAAAVDGARVFDPTAVFFVQSILGDAPARARAFGETGAFTFPFPVALKTGTSSDWRDNWAFGFTPEWTVGTWIGRARGTPMDRVSGTQGAILALREVLLFLHEQREFRGTETFAPPAGVERRRICVLSGETPGENCPESVDEWCAVSDPPAPVCRWHRRIPIDLATGLEADAGTPRARIRSALFTVPPAESGPAPFAWPAAPFAVWGSNNGWPDPPRAGAADEEEWVRGLAASMRPPGPAAAAGEESDERARRLRILRPADGAVYALDPSLPSAQQELTLEGANPNGALRWFVDGRELGMSRDGESLFWRLSAGRHTIRAVDAGAQPALTGSGRGVSGRSQGRDAPPSDEVTIEVEPAS